MNYQDVEVAREWRHAMSDLPLGWTMSLAVTKGPHGNLYIAQAVPDEDETHIVQGRPSWAGLYALRSLREALLEKEGT